MSIFKTYRKLLLFLFILVMIVSAGCSTHAYSPRADFITTRDTKWLLEDIDGQGVVDFAHIWVRFDSDGKIYGSGGCNNFRGYYTVENNEFKTGPLAMTRKACPKAINIQEFKFMQALENIETMYRKDGLLNMEGGGHTMRFSDSY